MVVFFVLFWCFYKINISLQGNYFELNCYEKLKNVILLLSLSVLVACNNMINQSFQIDIKESADQSISSTIPLEEALKALDNVLVSVGKDVANVDKQSIVSLSHCDMALVAPKKFLKTTSATMTRDTLYDMWFRIITYDLQ